MRLKSRTADIFDPMSTYVISGGLGGIGKSIAKWMVSRGARCLLLLSRSGVQSEKSRQFIEELKLSGVKVEAPACDIAHLAVLKSTLEKCEASLPPVKGCVQAAAVLRVRSWTF